MADNLPIPIAAVLMVLVLIRLYYNCKRVGRSVQTIHEIGTEVLSSSSRGGGGASAPRMETVSSPLSPSYTPPTLDVEIPGPACTGCGAALAPGKPFCTTCGRKVPETGGPGGGGDSAAGAGSSCWCAKSAVRCAACRQKNQNPPCGSCGQAILPGKAFCMHCGTKVVAPVSAAVQQQAAADAACARRLAQAHSEKMAAQLMDAPPGLAAASALPTTVLAAHTVDIEEQAASTGDALTDFLVAAKMQHHEEALRKLGCAMPEDLKDLEDGDFDELGMKNIEVTLLLRLTAEL